MNYPVLVFRGEADAPIPFSEGSRVAKARLPGTGLWRVPGADHVGAFEGNPDEFVERVIACWDARLK